MGHKVFVSYKYNDSQVALINDGSAASLSRAIFGVPTTARHYVDVIASKLADDRLHIYKGEEDGNNLSALKDDTIETKLKEKIRDSSVTVVIISKGMKTSEHETDQWIPWEVSYSLKEIMANGRISRSNGILAVVLPDETGSYSYYFNGCAHCGVINHRTGSLFQILRNNMFNLKMPIQQDSYCEQQHGKVHSGNMHSYAHQVKWQDFIGNMDYYINLAVNLSNNISSYNVQKVVWQ